MSLLEPVENAKGVHLHPCFSKEQPFIFVAAQRRPGGHWFVDFKHGRAFWSSGTIPGGFGRLVEDPYAMKILITGGTGFVGSAPTRRLLSDDQVTILSSHDHAGKQEHPCLTRLLADTGREGDWQRAVPEQDVLVNLAGRSIFHLGFGKTQRADPQQPGPDDPKPGRCIAGKQQNGADKHLGSRFLWRRRRSRKKRVVQSRKRISGGGCGNGRRRPRRPNAKGPGLQSCGSGLCWAAAAVPSPR